MVKVGSMTRAKQILLMASVLLVSVGDANASWLHHSKAAKPKDAAPAAAPSSMTLESIDSDANRIVLRTSGTPAYTSYSPSPSVFVVDLTSTSKNPAVAIPATLPSGVSSITAEEATEMGTKLTRVTVRLVEPVIPTASANDKSIVVTMPAAEVAEAKSDVPHVEAIPETAAPVVAEPVAKAEPLPIVTPSVTPSVSAPLQKAHMLKRVETSAHGTTSYVPIAHDRA